MHNENLIFTNLFSANSNQDVSCYRIPAIVTAPNGDIIVAIDERVPSCGDLKWSNDINIVIRRSMDNGSTWTKKERIVDYKLGVSASDPSMIVDEHTGDIFMFYNYMDLDNEKDVYYLHVIKSTDNGKTWGLPVDISKQISKPEWHNDFKFITSGRGTQTRKGRLLHSMVNLESGMHIFGSNDHGQSWYLIDLTIAPANESKIIELNDGRWMINSRVSEKGRRYVHISEDEGMSWISKPDEALIDPSCNASILNYNRDGKNILIFANAAHTTERENMTVRLSYDNGSTWSASRIIYPGASAYSTMTVLENGEIGLVFEKDNYEENVFVRMPIRWLEGGE